MDLSTDAPVQVRDFRVELVEPGNQFIEPGTEEVTNGTGVETKAGKLEDGRWVAWIEYNERAGSSADNPKRAVAVNKFVATGAVQSYYYE